MTTPERFTAACCLQFTIALGEPETNVQTVRQILARTPPLAHSLIVLPEMWATGFDYKRTAELAEQSPALIEALIQLARQYRCHFAGSLTGPQSRPSNRLYLIGPEGVLGHCDKQFLFRAWHEDQHYQPGLAAGPMASSLGLVGGIICYELRFPEVARELAAAGAQIMAVSAEWPLSRIDQWRLLNQVRALENQCPLLACNGCGQTGNMTMGGHSLIVGPDGQILAEAGESEGLISVPLDWDAVDQQRHFFCPPAERPWRWRTASKIVSLSALQQSLIQLRAMSSNSARLPKIVFTNGCFDLLHQGHVQYLEQARAQGDVLIVGLNSDRSVQAQGKGAGRPLQGEAQRAQILASLACVDWVLMFSEDTPLRLIEALRPDVLVKGADWPEEQIVGAKEVKSWGGQVKRIPLSLGQSTTALIRRAQDCARPANPSQN